MDCRWFSKRMQQTSTKKAQNSKPLNFSALKGCSIPKTTQKSQHQSIFTLKSPDPVAKLLRD